MSHVRLFFALSVLAVTGCSSDGNEDALPLTIVESSGVRSPELLNDGERAFEGARWDSDGAAHFVTKRAFVTFDLGALRPIDAAYIQGDNNDRFVLESSEDGARFVPLWTAPAVAGQGHRARWESGLRGRGRFIRLRGLGGDALVTATEIQVFEAKPSVWPPEIPPRFELSRSFWAQLSLGLFGLFAVLAAALHQRGSRRALSRALWTSTAIGALASIYAIAAMWPPDEKIIDLSRAVAATVACAAVLRAGLRPRAASQPMLTGLLAAMAVLSIVTFYDFGYPQFHDTADREPSYVHTWDLRVYFPAAKYFEELGYDGVYLASVKAYADEELGGSLEPIGHIRMRDLRTYEMRPIADVASEIHEVKERFSTERWRELTKDMSYFWTTMGPQAYLGSLRDHGANATPAWLLVAHWIYGSADASDRTFLLGALLDPALLLLFFLVAWRTFGLRPALVCIVAYGATTIYQFGSNWGGSTLRNDWMVLLGLGVCALAARRPFLAGLLLGWSAMIRAFPLLALLFLAAPLAWKVLTIWMARRDGSRASLFAPVLPLFKAAAGALSIALVLGALSTSTFGFEKSWGSWSEKIALHANKPNVNHLGVTALVGYKTENLWHELRARGEDPQQWGPRTAQTVRDRRWIIALSMLFFTVLGVWACREARLSDAAVIGTMMIPVYFYPANYYLHILFVWPLLHAATRDGPRHDSHWALIAASVLACCAIQWFGWLIPGRYGQYLFWSGTLLVLIAALLSITIAAQRRGPSRVSLRDSTLRTALET